MPWLFLIHSMTTASEPFPKGSLGILFSESARLTDWPLGKRLDQKNCLIIFLTLVVLSSTLVLFLPAFAALLPTFLTNRVFVVYTDALFQLSG